MNRTDRLYALVEELRAVAPRPRSAAWLASRFEVSVRTIERDLDALRQAGVPIWAENGRTGGYRIDPRRTLPPLSLTAAEALAISIALRSTADSPFAESARSAANKVRAALPEDVRRREATLAAHVHRVGEQRSEHPTAVRRAIEDAVVGGRALRLTYRDAAGRRTDRTVEPMGLLWSDQGWYLLAWCRLRDGVRGFHLDRIAAARFLDEPVAAVSAARERELRRELDRIDARPLRS
jgi:predicted DNA-binding transcriptional regulator YafY